MESGSFLPGGLSERGDGIDIFGWVVVDHQGVSDATANLNIDFADPTTAATPLTANGSFALPERPDSPLRDMTKGFVHVYSSHPPPPYFYGFVPNFLGFSARIDISADENYFEYDLEWIEPPGVDSPDVL